MECFFKYNNFSSYPDFVIANGKLTRHFCLVNLHDIFVRHC